MGAGGGKQTVGYRYHLGFRVVLCHGPVDGFRGIRYDGREVWSGNLTASGPIDVDLPDLMGGEKREGGIVGRFSVAFGDSAQGVNAYLQGVLGGNVPAFRRRLSVIAEQIYYGTNPYLKEFTWIPQRALSREVRWYDAKAVIGDGHMNPAHMIVDAITSKAFGAGLPLSAIDLTSFAAAADTLYTENFGLSLFWSFGSEPDAVPKFVQFVIDHIGGVLFPDPATGLIRLELLRGGYSIPALPLFDDSNCTISDYEDVQIGDTINEVVVTYTNPDTGEPRTISGQNIGNVNAQGRVVSTAIDYPGIMDDALAAKVLDRDLRALSTPLATAVLEVNRTGWDLYPGRVIRVSSAKLGISEGVFRVVEIDEPGIAAVPTLSARIVQDVFGLSSGSYVVRQPTQWVDPVQPVTDISLVVLREIPYYHLVTNLSAADMAALSPDYGFVQAFAQRDHQSWYSFAGHYSPDNITYTEQPSDGTFGPVLTLAAAIGPMDTAVSFSAMVDKQLVSVGNYGLLMEGATEEMVELTAWNAAAGTATLKRAVMDSVPHSFTAAAKFIVTSFPGLADSTERTDGETAWYKLTPRNRDGVLAAASATARSITLANRASRPYPPGNVRINTQYFPAAINGQSLLTIDWAHRDRLQQTAGLTPWTSGNIGPEPGTTYTLRLYGETDTLERTVTGLTGVTYTWADEEADSQVGTPGDPYWDNVSALLHMDGADGSTAFTDVKGHIFTAFGNAQIDTAQSRFGGASGLFDGTGDYISTAASADFGFGNGPYTVEGWFRVASQSSDRCLFDNRSSGIEGIGVYSSTSANANKLALANNSTIIAVSSIVAPLNAWVHWAVCRDVSGTVRGFINGAQGFSVTDARTLAASAPVFIGGTYVPSQFFLGHQDEVRITRGVARYVAAFNPPQSAFYEFLGGGLRLNGRIRTELESLRNGLVSRQIHDISVDRAGYGYQMGRYYGGA